MSISLVARAFLPPEWFLKNDSLNTCACLAILNIETTSGGDANYLGLLSRKLLSLRLIKNWDVACVKRKVAISCGGDNIMPRF